MTDVPPLFLTEKWTKSYRRKAQTPEGAHLCAKRDFWREGSIIYPVEQRPSNVIAQMLKNRSALAVHDKYFGWNYKTCTYSEKELVNIVSALQLIEKKAAREHEKALEQLL